jgi:3-phenylpropionate/cinnamic acid dioxygenase small subunit
MSGASPAELVRRLLARYCQLLDDSHFPEWTELFTPDGLWVLGERQYRGRAEMHAYMQQLRRDRPLWRTRHVCTNIVVDLVDAMQARATSNLALIARDGDAPWRVASLGRYEDQLVRAADGATWQFSERRLVIL